jgi:hypothetical protein
MTVPEGCPAGGINDAIRTIMAQLATWIAGAAGPLLKSGGAVTGAITNMANGSSVIDGGGTARAIGYRNLPLTAKTAGYTLAPTDVGQGVSITTGGITIPANATAAFAIGDVDTIYNSSAASQNIAAAAGVTLRLVGTATTGTRALAQRGICTLLKVGADEWVVSGGGVS